MEFILEKKMALLSAAILGIMATTSYLLLRKKVDFYELTESIGEGLGLLEGDSLY